uniref:Extracellular matrix receptor III n=1 Tax=Macaca fascicularis TaxID=9541 RepID=A0A2K5VJ36_MACFA
SQPPSLGCVLRSLPPSVLGHFKPRIKTAANFRGSLIAQRTPASARFGPPSSSRPPPAPAPRSGILQPLSPAPSVLSGHHGQVSVARSLGTLPLAAEPGADRYGFIEGHVVIPRIQPNSICAANHTGVYILTSNTSQYDTYCFNASAPPKEDCTSVTDLPNAFDGPITITIVNPDGTRYIKKGEYRTNPEDIYPSNPTDDDVSSGSSSERSSTSGGYIFHTFSTAHPIPDEDGPWITDSTDRIPATRDQDAFYPSGGSHTTHGSESAGHSHGSQEGGANTTSGPVRTPQIPEWLIILASLLALALILAVCIAVNSRRRCGQKKKLVINSGNGAVDDRKPSGLNGEASKSQEMVHLVNKEPSETPDQFMTADETRNLQNVDMKIGV